MQNQLIMILFGIILTLFLIGMPETFLLMREDKFKRGFLIYKRNLSKKELNFISNLKEDLVVYVPLTYLPLTYSFLSPIRQGFILTKDNQVFIQFRKLNWRTGLPYVGYIDLNPTNPSLEYRGSFLIHLSLTLLLVLIILAGISKVWLIGLFIVGVTLLNFRIEKDAIDSFLLSEIEKSKKHKEIKSKKQHLST